MNVQQFWSMFEEDFGACGPLKVRLLLVLKFLLNSEAVIHQFMHRLTWKLLNKWKRVEDVLNLQLATPTISVCGEIINPNRHLEKMSLLLCTLCSQRHIRLHFYSFHNYGSLFLCEHTTRVWILVHNVI